VQDGWQFDQSSPRRSSGNRLCRGSDQYKILEVPGQQWIYSVVSSVAADETGQAYNINADTVAGEQRLWGAEKLILLTDTAGILKDYKDPSTLLYKLDIQELAD